GNLNLPIIKDPTAIESADFLLLESTYGNRYHERAEQRAQLMRDTIKFTLAKGGNLIIPSFAVERTQDLLFDLCQLRRQGQLPEDVPVYIDSPLAIAATEVFRKNLPYWDDQTRQLVEAGHSPFDLPNLRFARTAEESRRLNEINGRTIIISASGMCDAGRIKHHLKHNLWRPEATILFVGYQAEGTLGRRLLEGEKLVRIHGEEPALNALADAIRSELHIPVHVPFWMEEVDLRLRKPPIQEMPVFEGDVQQALKAEHMYLQLRLKLNEEFQRSWRQQDYARLIEYLQEAGAALEQKTRGETGQEPR
ncbi:MAG: MBL fold metallo-hydrolase, partial [Syntrophomonadaceae bacterium]|nr:MBL fold metallo-hydrolase [Syntrophomonadaceae bacterium]